ncbi:centrosomal protein of 290 kDa isoform X2 [Sceloporus undulatus]|uniref:centrosomal protein of 290 kDa isoform X2 n=1 Tax=Sceloporus undulatus TaxID=8520 RepID=UPI001C4D6E3D|nr:centrosomal protein of 290 kDa isoform X2 [Sceloporus undulatus]
MAPILEWKKIMRVDPDALPHQEELADNLLEAVAKVDGNDLKDENPARLIQLFKISQSLMKMKNQEVELALEEVEKAGEEQAKFENQLKSKVMKLEKELEAAQRSTGGRDTRFLRDEIRQLERQLEQKDRELADMEKELEKEKKINEQLALRNEDAENENSKLRRENEQLRQDVIDYQRQIDTQKETLFSRRGEESDYRSQLSKKNFELVQYLDEIQGLTEANEKLEVQNQEMRKNLEESVQEMEKMTDEYNKMKLIVQQSDIVMDQLRKEKEQYRLQVNELTEQLRAKNEEDDPLMVAVNEKVEEWKGILASKDEEIVEYQQMLFSLREKLKMAQLDTDKSSVIALQQGVQERDSQIKLLTEQVEQYTKEMEKNALIIEDLKRELQTEKGLPSFRQQDCIEEMQVKLHTLEQKTKEAERIAEVAEADAREKDKELIDTLKRMKNYETGIYGLEDAVAEINNLKKQLNIRDHEIESLIKEVNKLELKINDFLDENEDLRGRLGLDPKPMIDLTEFKNSKALKQQQYKAENQILLKEIERLEEERVNLKQHIRKLAQEKGRRAATLGLDTDDLHLIDTFTEDLKMKRRKSEFMSTGNTEEIQAKWSCQLTSQVQLEDNSDGSKALTIDELYSSLGQESTEMLGTALCPISDEEYRKLKVEFPVSFSAMQTKQRTSTRQLVQRQERQMKKTERHSRAHMSRCSAETLPLDSQEALPLTLLGKPVSSYVVQEVLLKDEEDNSEIKLLDLRTDLQGTGKDNIYFPESWPVEHLEGEIDCGQPVKAYQIDRVESLIRQLKNELIFLRSENEQILRNLFARNTLNKDAELELDKFRSQKLENDYLAKELNERERDLEQNRNVIAKFQSKLKELVQENKHLEQGMKEILQAIKDMQKEPGVKGGETSLIIPSLERLVNAIELKNTEGTFDANLHLKTQVDQLAGRNEELRKELREARKEAINFSNQLAKANTKIANQEKDIELLRQSDGANIVFKAVNLPEGMAPSSRNIINSQNEYLIHLLQELEDKEQLLKKLEEAVEEYKRKFAVTRHQQGLLYKEYQSEREHWQTAAEKIQEEKRKLEYQKEQDDIKIKEYYNLLDVLQKDNDDSKRLFADYSRKITVLRVNERSLTRQYTTLLEMERHLRTENEKMRSELTSMEAAVQEKIGCLQRFKDMATFKIAALQKVLDDSVPLNDLEVANKQYNELTAKYRDTLQKDNLLVQRTTNLEYLESENASMKEQMESLNKELEITKEKLHTIEQAWEQTVKLGGDSGTNKAAKAITNTEIVSISKKITMLEMKELNERQRAEHSQRMYEHLRNTLKQVEERNFELEAKFAELTKINLETQKVEQSLRDELSNSVSKAVSEADRCRIMDLEKSETELKIEVSKLRELSDIAKMQVTALENRQQSREKEVESLRMQILDYQTQSDEKTLIAKLHQHVVALQISEATAVSKLESAISKLQKMEIVNMRLEQKLDDKEQALYYARLEGRNRAKHLRQTVQSLRRQFSGALPLAQQEKFSKTMIQLQNDKLKMLDDIQHAQQERRNAEKRTLELEMKLKGLEELLATLKDTRGAQKVIEWHMKIEELRLQELKLNRELATKKEEIKYLNSILSEYERTISNLEEEVVQQNKFHEERQMAWDQREVELERQLDIYDHQQRDLLSTAHKLDETTGSFPDPSLSLPHQLEQAIRKVREHVRTILEMQVTCKSLEEKLKEKEAALWKAEQNILSRDKVINELRLRLPASLEREKIIAQLDQKDDEPSAHAHALKVAHQTIANMQARLNQKEEVLKKYQLLLAKAREEQEEIAKKHEEDLRVLHQKLDLHADNSFNKFKQTAMELMKKPSIAVTANKHFIRLAEMEQTVAEQDSSLASLLNKLKKTSSDLQKQKQITLAKIKEFDNIRAQHERKHAAEEKKLKDEVDELRSLLSQMEKELMNTKTELEVQREANNRAPTTTMKNLVERLKNQLALKEKQQKTQIEDLNDQLSKIKDALKSSKNKENSLLDDLDDLNQELQKKTKAHVKVLREKDEMEKENEELKKRIKRLSTSVQSKADDQSLIDELQRKIKKMEIELGKKTNESEKKSPREDKSQKEELIRWEESKKWQTKTEGMRNKLKEKEKEVESLTKQLTTVKELFSKADKEKLVLQKKLKSCGVTVDQVVGARVSESERELEELRKRNMDLENEIVHLKTQYAVPRDSVVEDLHLKNRYLQERLVVLEKQLSKDTFSRPSNVPCETTSLANTPISINSFSKHNHLKHPPKKTLLDKTKSSHQSSLIMINGKNNGVHKSHTIDESQEVAESVAVNGAAEAQFENVGKQEDLKASSEAEKCSSPEAKNIIEQENVSAEVDNVDQQWEISKKETEEICKHSRSGNDEEKESRHESCPEKENCIQSDSDETTNLPSKIDAEMKNNNEEVVEDICESHETAKGKSGFCEVPQTSGLGSDDQYQKEQELQKENLMLSSENMELRFQLEQANKDLPRLKNQVADLKEMCELLKREKAEAERKLGNVRGSGRSGKTIPELEKTIGLMKKVVERVQRENEELKKAPRVVSSEKMSSLEQENECLKSELEKLKLHLSDELSTRYELKSKGTEKIIAENERIRKELKKEAENAEKLRIAKINLEIINEKLSAELEEKIKKLNMAESRIPQLEGADSKSWKSMVITRMYENKMKEMEADIAKKAQAISDLKQQLEKAKEEYTKDIKEQIGLLQHYPESAQTEQELIRELQLLRLANDHLEKEKAELVHQLEASQNLSEIKEGQSFAADKTGNYKLLAEDLKTQLKTSDLEQQRLQEEVRKLKNELDNFDPSFFEEIEDLKYNYNEEVKKNIILEERLKTLSEQFGVHVDIPAQVSID